MVFKHDPLGPGTRYVVARTPIDRGARGYAMSAPPRLRMLAD